MPPGYRIGRIGREYALVYYDEDRRRHRYRLGTYDAREAERRAPAIFEELTRPKGQSVDALWRAYCNDRKGRAVMATMVHTWKALRDRFGPMSGSAITIADCRAHIEARRNASIRDGTIYTELGHLRTVLKWAERHTLIERAPYIERPSKPPPKDRHLTREQVRRLASACTAAHLRLFVILSYSTAGRAGAILDLTWDRCDFERGIINLENPDITTPHKGRAIVPMTRTIRAALLSAKPAALSPYVIEWAGDKVRSVKKGLATAGVRADIGHVSAHMLRHSSAVQMAESGEPMEEIASFLGHRDTSVTRRVYARFSPHHLRRAASALELDDLTPVLVRKNK